MVRSNATAFKRIANALMELVKTIQSFSEK